MKTALKLALVACVGVLAVILLYPSVTICRGDSQRAKCRAQFVGYLIALNNFKSAYGAYPSCFAEGEALYLAQGSNAEDFMQALSARDASDKPVAVLGNKRAAAFYAFAESEYAVDPDTGQQHLVDAFGNRNIVIRVDHDGDGFILQPVDGALKRVKAQACVYTLPLDSDTCVVETSGFVPDGSPSGGS
jgi:hypothetical protein